MRHDLRLAFRQVRKNPGFALSTILMLAIGIGATTSMFSLVNSVLLRPLPFPQPDRLVSIDYLGTSTHNVSYPSFFDFRAQNHSLASLASYRDSGSALTGAGAARMIAGVVVSANFFDTLGVAPALGRDFTADDEKHGRHVVMLSWSLWQSAFGGQPGIIGGTIKLDGASYLVAGVMPRDFAFPITSTPRDAWTTLADDDDGGASSMVSQRQAGFLTLVGRLKPGVSMETARADLGVIARNLAVQYVKEIGTLTNLEVIPEMDNVVGDTRPALRVLFAAVSFVLLIGCVNVAGLMLARVSRRRPEIALLAAIGAQRSRILRQILVEAILLSVCGGAVGILVATWGTDALLHLLPSSIPRLDHISIDRTVLLFATAVSMLTGILAGVLPAWNMSRIDPISALRDANRSTAGRGQHLLQNSLVIAETALGLVLVAGSGLLIRSFIRIENVQPGFDPHNVLAASLSVPDDREKRFLLRDELTEQVAAIPGVDAVSFGWPLPLSGSEIDIGFEIEGRPNAPGHEPSEFLAIAAPDYFRVMRIPIVAGREFTASDTAKSAPVMLVNEAFARKYFPGENVIGKHIQPGLGDAVVKAPMREVIGLVGNVKRAGLKEDFVPQYYLPWTQAAITMPTLVIRTSVDPASIISTLRSKVAAIDPDVPLYRVRTLGDIIDRAAIAEPRFQTLLLAGFAAMAMFLAAVGLYAVLSYTVAQRAGEIGVRMALGAQRGNVLGLILGRGALLAIGGITIGLGASALLTRNLASLLYGVQPLDPSTFTIVSALLLIVSLAASAAPAIRASRVDPMRVLRDQ
jgi:predicted permease